LIYFESGSYSIEIVSYFAEIVAFSISSFSSSPLTLLILINPYLSMILFLMLKKNL